MDWQVYVRSYFVAVHQSLVDGKYERLRMFYTKREQSNSTEWERLGREYKQAAGRDAKIFAASGQVVPLFWMETESEIQIMLSWHGQRHYRIMNHDHTEADQRLLRIRLNKGKEWTISEIREWDGDAKGDGGSDEEEDTPVLSMVEDAITQPLLIVHGAGGYHADNAVAYAERYWNSVNPVYPHFTDDCTNFISQCLHAGGIPMLFSKEKTKGWWIRTGKGGVWSYSWSVAHSLYLLLKSGGAPMRAVVKSSPEQLVPGDIICYDFDGNGRFQHNTIVVAKDPNNMPLVNAHTTDSSMRYWAYEDSTAYTPQIRYAFFHIRGM